MISVHGTYLLGKYNLHAYQYVQLYQRLYFLRLESYIFELQPSAGFFVLGIWSSRPGPSSKAPSETADRPQDRCQRPTGVGATPSPARPFWRCPCHDHGTAVPQAVSCTDMDTYAGTAVDLSTNCTRNRMGTLVPGTTSVERLSTSVVPVCILQCTVVHS
eukprot:SAG11_NODE_280_length_11266_cov_28.949499_3_plen_160_part_00